MTLCACGQYNFLIKTNNVLGSSFHFIHQRQHKYLRGSGTGTANKTNMTSFEVETNVLS